MTNNIHKLEELFNDILAPGEKPEDKIYRLFKKELGANNGRKYLSGAKLLANQGLEILSDESVYKPDFAKEEVEFKSDNSRTVKKDIYLTEDEAASPESIMKKMGFDPLLWEVISCKVTRGNYDVTLKLESIDVDGKKASEPKTITNYKYSVVLSVKPITGYLTTLDLEEVFSNIVFPKIEDYKYDGGNKLLELPFFDVHFGKYADPNETGQEPYNLEIAETIFKNAIMDILSKVDAYGLDIMRIVFPIGQDFFHFDTINGTTTSGTPVDTDGKWHKVFEKGVEVLIWAIEQLRVVAPVDVFYVAGNHDKAMSYYATVGLYHLYRESENVNVLLGLQPRRYVKFGKCLIGFSHGRKEGKRIQDMMQLEVPEYWGETQFREMHMGDLHHEASDEGGGVMYRRISSITPPDEWHAEKGYIGAQRKAMAFVWDAENGLELMINSLANSEKIGEDK